MADPDRPGLGPRRAPAAIASAHCSFCNKPREQVRSLLCGPTPAVAICDECVDLCGEIIREQLAGPAPDGPPAAA